MKKTKIFACIILLTILLSTGHIVKASEPATLYIEPYLQNVTKDSISILWWTYSYENLNTVEYGESFEQSVKADSEYIPQVGKYLNQARLTDLKADTTYNYRVISGSIASRDYTFKTAVERDSNFHFVLLGDGRTDNDIIIGRHRKVTEMAMEGKT